MQNNTVYLAYTDKKTYIRILDGCQDDENLGAISLRKKQKTRVWLSLKKRTRNQRHLISEIAGAGGSFVTEPGYARSGTAIGISGTGYQGGIPLDNIDEVIAYLQLYFPVSWCDSQNSDIPKEAKTSEPQILIAPPGTNQSLGCSWNHLLSQTAIHFTKHSSAPTTQTFSQFYQDLKDTFSTCGRLKTVKGKDSHDGKKWPKEPGVYVVRKLDAGSSSHQSIAYVGMTGKLSRIPGPIPGKLSTRPGRWDPYCFDVAGFHHHYNRRKKVYGSLIDPADFTVDCFLFDSFGVSAPTFLESLILQAYALCITKDQSRLPAANNQF
ncbi:MAG: hypothetical protein ACKODK_09080 [Opitutaceae bacterium]